MQSFPFRLLRLSRSFDQLLSIGFDNSANQAQEIFEEFLNVVDSFSVRTATRCKLAIRAKTHVIINYGPSRVRFHEASAKTAMSRKEPFAKF